jgi:hypothetical protein
LETGLQLLEVLAVFGLALALARDDFGRSLRDEILVGEFAF